MSRPPSRAVTAIRILADVTIALYLVVVVLLVLTWLYPTWGIDPTVNYDIYFPPQFTAAVLVGLFTFALATLLGVICVVQSSAAGRPSWAVGFRWVIRNDGGWW